jgi:hypothetical protein
MRRDAGITPRVTRWVPAFAGITARNDEQRSRR